MESSNPKELERLKKIQAKHQSRSLFERGYYGSDEYITVQQQLKKELKQYLEDNPKDYTTRGIDLYNMLWEHMDRVAPEERRIYKLTGMGLYYEDLEEYNKAIELYQEADDLTMSFLKDEIAKLTEEHGEKDYLYTAKLRQKIRNCQFKEKRKEIVKLEDEAKELEETNPLEAINKYGELNRVNPNLKKYNKAIARIVEKMAKEREKTNPEEAILLYNKLNEINPNLKKYNKRIEICKKKLDN